MSEAEKQEGQKTVVAFITGLLIGGLLVWVFSSTPEKVPTESVVGDTTEDTTPSTVNTSDVSTVTPNDDDDVDPVAVVGNGLIIVMDQKAGASVALGNVTYPANVGWVVVRDYMNGTPGNILGAARYSLDEGLTPNSVSLLRNTAVGNTYQVVFYSENGDDKFLTTDDVWVKGGEDTFKAN